MPFKIVLTEFWRDLHNTTSTFIFSLLLGFIVFFVSGVSNYLNKIFESPKWNADLVVLPKGITPELAIANLLKGLPDGLIPIALFNTLLQQSQGSSIKVLGFIPFKNNNSEVEIALTDTDLKDFTNLKDNSLWSDLAISNLNLKRSEFRPREYYETPEWHDQVIMGILVKGSIKELNSFKNLIDRKTVAQAFFVGNENSLLYAKLTQLKTGLYTTTGFVLLTSLLGLLLALKNMSIKRNSLDLVLKELKYKPNILKQIKLIQILAFIILPILIGILISTFSFEVMQRIIFNI